MPKGGMTRADKRDVMNYRPPVGPKGISNSGPGLGGENCGNAGTQGKTSCNSATSGGPGQAGGDRPMRGGTQGRY